MIDRLFSEIHNLPQDERNGAIKKMLDVFRENPEIFEDDPVSQGIIRTLNKIEETTENNPIAMATFFKTMEREIVRELAESAEIFARMGEGKYYVISLKETYEFLKDLEESSNELLKEAIEKQKAIREEIERTRHKIEEHDRREEERHNSTREKVEEEGRKIRSEMNSRFDELGSKIDTYYKEIRSLIENGKKSVEDHLTKIIGEIGNLKNVSKEQVEKVNEISSQLSRIYRKFDKIGNYLKALENGNENLENILYSLSGDVKELKRYAKECKCSELKDVLTRTYKSIEKLRRELGKYLRGESEENPMNLTTYNPMDIMIRKIEETGNYIRKGGEP